MRRLSGLVADGADVDWTTSGAVLPPSQRAALQVVARMGARARHEDVEPAAEQRSWVDAVGRVLGVLATIQVVLALVALAAHVPGEPPGRVPRGFQLTTMIVSLFAAAVLSAIAARDPAARALALVYVGIAAAFARVFGLVAPSWLPHILQTSWSSLSRLPGDLALVVGVWNFVMYFPRVETGAAVQQAASLLARAATFVVTLLLAAHVWLVVGGPVDGSAMARVIGSLDRYAIDTRYWSVVFPLMAAATPFALRKLHMGYVSARRQVRWFLVALMLGFGPLVLLSALGSTSAAAARMLRSEQVFPAATLLVFAGLWTLPLTTAAAVMTRDVLPLGLVVRRSLQYTLTRQALFVAIIVPIAGAALLLLSNPSQTIGEFLANGGSAWLTAAALATAAAVARRHILRGIDRLFLRSHVDPRSLIAALGTTSRRKLSARDAGEALLAAVHAAFHPAASALLVENGAGLFAPIVGSSEPLSASSALARVLEASPSPLSFAASPENLARLLPAADRAWAASQGWRVLSPLHGEGESLVGVLCVGRRASADDFSTDDLATLEALCSAMAPLLASRVAVSAPRHGGSPVLGSECERCGRLFDHLATKCRCGGALVGSVLPAHVAGRFTLRRRLGRGGMGVVYQATDDALGRDVALKTLPEIGPDEAAQLRTEARTMASLQHPGLAFVLGLETFGPCPVLVVEYLAGGTLAERLRRGPLRAAEVVDLGLGLADALVYLHDMGLLHRDLKPSNVGFTADGRPKLLDFGVAVSVNAAVECGAAGTMLYMPPEAFAGARPSPVFDLWSLGVLLCEAWLGRHPLAALSTDQQMRSLQAGGVWAHAVQRLPSDPASLVAVLETALARDGGRRYPTAQALRSALERCRTTN